MPRSTKIVATLGPASSKPDVLRRVLAAGVDVVRLNFSHGSARDHVDLATLVRDVPLAESLEDVRWQGIPRARFEAWCDELGARSLVPALDARRARWDGG